LLISVFFIKSYVIISLFNEDFVTEILSKINIESFIFYDSAKEAAASIGISYNSFNHYINGRTKRKLPFIYV
jgi:hypothetical protein